MENLPKALDFIYVVSGQIEIVAGITVQKPNTEEDEFPDTEYRIQAGEHIDQSDIRSDQTRVPLTQAELTKYDRSTFYGGQEKGYTDYPFLG